MFSLGVSQHIMHKITNLGKFELIWTSKLQHNNERRKKTLSHEVVCVKMVDFETSNSKSDVSKSNSQKKLLLFENYVTSDGAVSHNVL